MRHAINIPLFWEYADPARVVRLAVTAERAGWDGFFVCDHLVADFGAGMPVGDAQLTLAAVAMATERVLLGPVVTPLARRRPWKVARETVALDLLSGGRTVFGVGLGYPAATEFGQFGEECDDRVRAARLDEGLDVLAGLWTGEEFSYAGAQHRLEPTVFRPVPRRRIPVWVAGVWPRLAPFRRAARWDGVVPLGEGLSYDEMLSPDQLREVVAFVTEQREDAGPFDVVHWGVTPEDDLAGNAALVKEYAAAGATWWMETLAPGNYGWDGAGPWPFEAMDERVRRGPARWS